MCVVKISHFITPQKNLIEDKKREGRKARNIYIPYFANSDPRIQHWIDQWLELSRYFNHFKNSCGVGGRFDSNVLREGFLTFPPVLFSQSNLTSFTDKLTSLPKYSIPFILNQLFLFTRRARNIMLLEM